jgi:enoyl-CoA hydratase
MGYETLLVEMRGQVAVVTLNRPQVLNALNAQMMTELDEAFAALGEDDGVRVVLLTGSGEKAFAAGADIRELAEADAKTGEALARRGQGVFGRIAAMGKPVIALVNGFALGGGCELAVACTLRIASERAKLGQPEVKLGLLPGYGGTQRLPRLVGRAAALKMVLTGEPVDSVEALRIGLVDEVVPAGELMMRGEAIARMMVAVAPVAVRACLDAVRDGADMPLGKALELEAEAFGRLCATEDKREGTAAFLEKRAARWVGR